MSIRERERCGGRGSRSFGHGAALPTESGSNVRSEDILVTTREGANKLENYLNEQLKIYVDP
jgi:hypothetical protein